MANDGALTDPTDSDETLSALRDAIDLIRIAPAFFGFVSPEGRILNVNDRALDVIAAQRSQIIGRRFWEAPWWSSTPGSEKLVREAVLEASAGRTRRFDLEYWAAAEGQGELRWVTLELTPERDAEGKVVRISATGIDITDRVRAEQGVETARDQARHRLEKSERELRTFIEAMPQMAFMADPDGSIIYFNQRWFDFIGKEGSEGWSWSNQRIHHPDDLKRTMRTWQESIRTGKDYEIEYRLRRRDGTYRWHLGRAVAIRDEAGNVTRWIGTNTDIHDQKSLHEQLKEERDLRERFVSMLSHDLRTPLAAAKISAQFLPRKVGDPVAIRKLSDRIGASMDRADGMIRDFLDANRIRAGEPLPIDVAACDLAQEAADAMDELSAIHGDRFILQAPDSIRGFWSRSDLGRIIENLAGNAVKYGAPDRPVTIRLECSGGKVTLQVHNEGPPIPDREQASLFEPYRRTGAAQSGSQKGWGLGLALVQGIAVAHGGSAGVRSTPGDGTTFWVTLPIDARPASRLSA